MKARALALSTLMALSMVVGGVSVGAGGAAAGTTQVDVAATDLPGSGTASDPWRIDNASELQAVADRPAANYTLAGDVDASNTSAWNDDGSGARGFEPIGSTSGNFTGTFDGNGYTVTGLTIHRPSEDFVGLFGVVQGGTITGVTLEDATVNGSSRVGGLVGWHQDGTVVDSSVAGTVTGSRGLGGLVGVNVNGTIRSSSATGAVSLNQHAAESLGVGGLVGANGVVDYDVDVRPTPGGPIVDSTASTTVTLSGDETGQAIGGLVGFNYDASVLDSHASGDIVTPETPASAAVGGLVGANGGTVRESSASGAVRGGLVVGALVGGTVGPVSGSHASGEVSSFGFAGGLVGASANDSRVVEMLGVTSWTGPSEGVVRNSSATGAVAGGVNVGGLVGANGGKRPIQFSGGAVRDSKASGTVNLRPVDITENLGGLVGLNYQGAVSGVSATGDVRAGPATNVGGLVGQNDNSETRYRTIERAAATGSVDGARNVGGLVGLNRQDDVRDSHATGAVAGTWNVGGLIGLNDNRDRRPGTINRTYATGPVTGYSNVGGLLGQNVDDLVDNSYATGTVSLTSDGPVRPEGESDARKPVPERFGGLVGSNLNGTVAHSNATGDVDAPGAAQVGGLVGYTNKYGRLERTIKHTSATGSVTGRQAVGGLVGVNLADLVTHSVATGSVTGTSNVGGLVGGQAGGGTIDQSSASGLVAVTDGATAARNVGGLLGWNLQGTVTLSNATGDVRAGTATNVGGLVGNNTNQLPTAETVSASYTTGSVVGGVNVGGLVGRNADERVIDSYAVGTVRGSQNVGGLVGNNTATATVTRSYAAGEVVAEGDTVGGLVGTNATGTVADAYWDTETTGQPASAGNATGLPTRDLKGAVVTETTALDFDTTWRVDRGDAISYPYLADNTQSPAPGREVVSDPGDDLPTGYVPDMPSLQDRLLITVEPIAHNGSRVSVSNASGVSRIDVNETLTAPATGLAWTSNVTVVGLGLSIDDPDFWFNVTAFESPGTVDTNATAGVANESLLAAARAFENRTGTVAGGYVRVVHDLDETTVSNATVTFEIRQRYLAATGVDATDVTLYRHGSDGPTPLETSVTDRNETHVRFESTSPGLSVFPIGTGTQKFDVRNASLARSRVAAGEQATVTATVVNRGSVAGEKTVSVTAGEQTLRTETVSLPAGTARQVRLAVEGPVGTWNLSVDGSPVGQLQVEDTPTPTTPAPTTPTPTTPAPTTTDPSTPDETTPRPTTADGGTSTTHPPAGSATTDEDGASGVVPLVLVGGVAVLLGAGLVRRARGATDESGSGA